jgi:hypothetical protein
MMDNLRPREQELFVWLQKCRRREVPIVQIETAILTLSRSDQIKCANIIECMVLDDLEPLMHTVADVSKRLLDKALKPQ